MQRNISLFLLAVLVLSCVASHLWAQANQGDTASHRRIPLSDGTESSPSRNSFVPRELRKEYLERWRNGEYRKLPAEIPNTTRGVDPSGNGSRRANSTGTRQPTNPLRQRSQSGRPSRFGEQQSGNRSQFDEGSRARTEFGNGPQSVEGFSFDDLPDLGLGEDPLENTRKIMERVGRTVGESISEIRKPNRSLEVLKEYRDGMEKYKAARELFRQSWPDDSVAPEKWFEKVQPFINPELIEQIKEASNQFESQQGLPPSERRFTNLEKITSLLPQDGSKSDGMLKSLMKSIDKKSTDFLKSTDKKKSSLWKNLSKSAREGITNLNQKMTANSKHRARASATRSSSLDRPLGSQPKRTSVSSSPSTTDATTRDDSGTTRTVAKPGDGEQSQDAWIVAVVALLCGMGVVAYLMRDRFLNEQPAISNRVLAARIHDRDSLLAACHVLALDLFGFRSRFWHHRKLFASLAERIDAKQKAVNQLSALYEQARYAPRQLLDTELDRAKELFVSMQRHLRSESQS